MQYTVAISEKTGGQWQAIVTDLPYCTAEAATREEVLEQIKNNLNTAASTVEFLQIEAPANGSQNGHTIKSVAEEWPGFGSHPNDPDWTDFFDELDRQRL